MKSLTMGILFALTFFSVGCQQQYRPADWQDRSSNIATPADSDASKGSSQANLDRFGKLTPWSNPGSSKTNLDERSQNAVLTTLPNRNRSRGNLSTLPGSSGSTLPSRKTGTTLPSTNNGKTSRITTLPRRSNSSLPSRGVIQNPGRFPQPTTATTLPGKR